MRYGPDHKEKTHEKILDAAARRFREQGYRATGVDAVMRDAGLTVGGFYAHFPSKSALLTEALDHALGQMRGNLFAGLDGLDGAEWLRAVVGRYLSRTHRDMPASGCPLPSLSSEIAREDGAPREELEHYLKTMVAELATRTPDAPGLSSEDRVLATVALLVGALTLSRAVPDPELSDRLLRASRRLAVPETAEAATAEHAARTEKGSKR